MIYEFIFIFLIGLLYYNTFQWLIDSWINNVYYSHGFLVLIVSIYIIWRTRKDLLNTERTQSLSGLIFFLLGIIIFGIGNIYIIRFLSGLSLILTIFGVLLYLYGWKFVNKIKFPLFFLLLSIPIPFTDFLIPPMQTISATLSSMMAIFIGLPVQRAGYDLYLANSSFEVAAECSGINSMISLFTLSVIYAFILDGKKIMKFFIISSAIPLAIFGNTIRIVSVLSVANKYGQEFALNYFHDFSSLLVFIIVLIGLFLVGRIFGCLKIKKF